MDFNFVLKLDLKKWNMLAKPTLAKIHLLLKERGLLDQKKNIVAGFTGGRTDSTKDITYREAVEIISYLSNTRTGTPGNRMSASEGMQRKLIAMAHELGWQLPNGKVNMNTVNDWCIKYSYLHKRMDDYTYQEFPKLLTQFEQGPYKHFLKNF